MISFNTPSSVMVATQSNWTASNTVYDLRMPSIESKEAHPWGSQDVTGLFEKFNGGKNYVEANFGRHFEEDRLDTVINATGTTVGSLGAVTYTIVSADTITGFPSVQLPYIATGTAGFPSLGGTVLVPVRVHEKLVFPGNIIGKVTAVSGATFTCTPTGTTDLPTTLATDEITSLGLSVPEGFKDQITSNNWREHVVYWNSEIMRDAHESTGTAMVQKTWIPFTYNGETKYIWWFKGQQGAYKQMRNKREMSLVFGQAVTNATTLPANYSAQYQQTNGLIVFAESFGNNTPYDLTTGMTLEDLKTIIIDTWSKNAGATENCLYESISFKDVIGSLLRVEMQNGAIQYDQLSGGKEAYVNLDFDSWKILGYTVHDTVYSVFNNPTLIAQGSKYKNFAFSVPMQNDMYQCAERKEKVDCPPMRINYLKMGDQNREWKETLTGWDYNNNGDYAKIDFLSECAFEGFGSNRFLTIYGKDL